MSRPDFEELCKAMRDYRAPLAWPADERRAAEQVTEEWFYRLAVLIDRPKVEGRMSTDRQRNDVAIARSIAGLLAKDSVEGLNLPGVARLINKLCDYASGDPGVAVAPTIFAVLSTEASDQAMAQAVRATPQGQVVAVAPYPRDAKERP